MFQDFGKEGNFNEIKRDLIVIFSFPSEAVKLGYGLGGQRGLKQLPQHIVDRVSSLLIQGCLSRD